MEDREKKVLIRKQGSMAAAWIPESRFECFPRYVDVLIVRVEGEVIADDKNRYRWDWISLD
jgi:hypothetical protein